MTDTQTAPLPPGPKGNIIFTSRKELQHDMLGLLQRNIIKYPGLSRLKIGPHHFVTVSKPEYIERIFTDTENFSKGKQNFKMRFLLGLGLLTNEGAFWLKQRRLMQPLFHKQRLQGFVQSISQCTLEMLNDWDSRKVKQLDIHTEMTKVTLGIVSRTLMSTDASGEFKKVSDALEGLMKGLTGRNRSIIVFPYWVPTPMNLQMKSNRKLLWNTIYDIIAERRASTQKFDDLLTMLMEVEDADTAERMTDEQLKDELITMYLAGHETTANAMSFAFYLLAKHPEARQRVADEYRTLAKEGIIDYKDLPKLDYTTRVVKEAMRLYPPAWGILRETLQDTIIGEYMIKKGDNIVVAPYAMHRDPSYWTNPEAFDPDRFLPENIKKQHKYTYFPFGGGARMCIGTNFAMMEMQILLGLIASRYSFAITDDTKLELEPLITLRPKNGLVLGAERQ